MPRIPIEQSGKTDLKILER